MRRSARSCPGSRPGDLRVPAHRAGRGSDPARLRTTATPVEGGYRINGIKLWATNGTIASLLVVMARVPDAGITAFVVEADSEGVTVERRNEFLGLRGLENSVTRFHDVFVPDRNVVGGVGKG